jgi:hypothetical protein
MGLASPVHASMTTRFEEKEKALEFHLLGIAAPLPVRP